ncbi:mucoidy inhibitor MuiA family protein [Spirosoma foliorum]|uniref:Mucoidy inhibitor MuiA family protein n=1 Tax=Spirosoma foliorum TaxID=2710596 RepID=A0A7G5GQN4_9BACT|nr:mucoidy inhibitor MuiA family protein [Spirosoma foliorum]QMW01176.1 mucoidy inhibitor MuiA family protein [Spirosoma foliorum]
MKIVLMITTLCLGSALSFAQVGATPVADEQRVQATLRQVTVFLTRAQLSSHAVSTLDVGTTRLVIDNVPAQTDPQSIQVSGKGDAIIQGVQFRTNFLTKASKPASLQRLEDSLRANREAYELLTVQEEVLQQEKKLILANQQVGGKTTGTTVKEVADMAAFYRERLTKIGQELLLLNRRMVEQKKRVERLDAQVTEQNAKRERPVGEIEITLTAKSKTPVELELSYVVSNAGWSPIYDVRVRDAKSPASLAYKAQVYQNTGFDWQNVRLTLSTANPALPGSQPQLSTDYVGFYEPRPKFKAASDNQMLQEVVVTSGNGGSQRSMSKASALSAPQLVNTATVTQAVDQPTNVSFVIALPYTILTNSRPQLVDVQTAELPAIYRYELTPKLDNDAFLTAQITGWDKLNLLNGPARIYFEGTFVGESSIDLTAAEDTLRLSLGRDKRIVAKREQVEDVNSRKTIGSNQRESHSYRISLRNTRQEPIDLTVYDQIPVSTDSRIEVSLTDAGGAGLNSETGKLTYRLILQPGESRALTFRYEIKYPKGRVLSE